MVDLVVDHLGIPVEEGDAVIFGISNSENQIDTIRCSYYEGIVVKIDDNILKPGRWNRIITVFANEYPNQVIHEMVQQANGEDSMKLAESPQEAWDMMKNMNKEERKIPSNDVICVSKVRQIASIEYAEFFI